MVVSEITGYIQSIYNVVDDTVLEADTQWPALVRKYKGL